MSTARPSKASPTFRKAAEAVLREATIPLGAKEIFERAQSAGLIHTSGKTPEATMAAQIYTEIQEHGKESIFVRSGKALFGLRSWGSSTAIIVAGFAQKLP